MMWKWASKNERMENSVMALNVNKNMWQHVLHCKFSNDEEYCAGSEFECTEGCENYWCWHSCINESFQWNKMNMKTL